jgi:uncharacterized protein HemY
MRARAQLNKALLLLDHGRTERGETVLDEAIEAARQEADTATLVTALCCLGDLYAQQSRREEATQALTECLAIQIPPALDDLCEVDRTRAQHLLARQRP